MMKMKYNLIKEILLIIITLSSLSQSNFLENKDEPPTDQETYCVKLGGEAKTMVAQYDTHAGWINGIQMKFCLILNQKGNLGIFGLQTLGSEKPSLAATYVKTIQLEPNKQIPGPYGLNNMNLCHQLRGAMITFVTNGGYDDKGQSDLCFFGDGSAVSGWTLYYLGIGGVFDGLKDKVLSEPLLIDLPNVYFKGDDDVHQ